jgi:hypothetical protein
MQTKYLARERVEPRHCYDLGLVGPGGEERELLSQRQAPKTGNRKGSRLQNHSVQSQGELLSRPDLNPDAILLLSDLGEE